MTYTRIDPEDVDAIFRDCFYREAELPEPHKMPADGVRVDGITQNYGFNPERLKKHSAEVRGYLALLPRQFHKSTGGGWTFLSACNQDDGEQWTDFHQRMEQLFCLGIGLGLVKWCLPKEMWEVLPGGMPYVVIDLEAVDAR